MLLSLTGIALSLGSIVIGATLFHTGLHAIYEVLMVGNATTLQMPLSLILSLLATPLTFIGLWEFRKNVRTNGG